MRADAEQVQNSRKPVKRSGQIEPVFADISVTFEALEVARLAGANAPAQIVASPPTSQQNTDLRLGRGELTVLLEDRPATDAGVDFFMSDLIEMRTRDLVGVLSSMGQAVGKRRPTRLELLGGVVTLLCDMGRLRL